MIAASTATVRGWESMMTLPRPAEVLCRPSARHPWNAVPSTRAKIAMASHAIPPDGIGLPLDAAHATSTAPAGTSLTDATKSGLVAGSTSFMATMDVPHRKKGDTSATPPSAARMLLVESSSLVSFAPSSRSPSSSLNTHATSVPTSTHSRLSSGLSSTSPSSPLADPASVLAFPATFAPSSEDDAHTATRLRHPRRAFDSRVLEVTPNRRGESDPRACRGSDRRADGGFCRRESDRRAPLLVTCAMITEEIADTDIATRSGAVPTAS